MKIIKILSHRNFLLTSALVFGLLLGEKTLVLAQASVYILALVMVFATVDFSFSVFAKPKQSLVLLSKAFFLNYIVFAAVLLSLSYFLFPGSELWVGCVLLAASPPGPSVVPFAAIMKGDVNYGVIGLFGLHLIALVATPLIMVLFTGNNMANPMILILVLLKTIVVPVIISRPLRHKKVLPFVQKIKGKIINWGFFLIILPIVGQSKSVMIQNPKLITESIVLFFITMFVVAFVYVVIERKRRTDVKNIITSGFFLTTKSSAFAAVVVFTVGNETAAIPAAVHAFFVTVFFLVFSNVFKLKNEGV
jgi:bile acid:Na+ symporter, BASS family